MEKTRLVKFFRSNKVNQNAFLKKSKLMRVNVESGEASSSAPLGPLLGQFQIPLLEFCNSFNDKSSESYFEHVDVGIRLHKFDSNFVYYIKYPSFSFFVRNFYLGYGFDLEELIFEYYVIKCSDLWFLIHIFSSIWGCSVFKASRLAFGFLKSSIIRIILFYMFIVNLF